MRISIKDKFSLVKFTIALSNFSSFADSIIAAETVVTTPAAAPGCLSATDVEGANDLKTLD